MLLNVLAPEWPFGHAVNGIVCEQTLRAAFDVFREQDDVQWTRTHTQLANMGGFVVGFDEAEQRRAEAAGINEERGELAPCVIDGFCHKCECSDSRHRVLLLSAKHRLRP